MFVRIIHFLRPTFFAMIAFALIVGAGGVVQVVRDSNGPNQTPKDALAGLQSVDLSGIELPRPTLPPDEVVRLQLAGLANPRADGIGVLQCFVLASPGNRAATGPLDRFGKMVRQGHFQCLANPRACLVGRPHIVERTARVMVTIVDQQAHIHAFTFVLARQADPPFADCWMTEGVWPSLPAGEPPVHPAA